MVLVVFYLFNVAGLFSAKAGEPVIVRGADLHDLSTARAPISLSNRPPVQINFMSINLTFGPGLASDPAAQQAFARAAARWSAVLADPVSVNISVDYESLGPGVLGESYTTMLVGGYSEVRDLVAAGGDSGASYEGLLPRLPTIDQWSMYVPQNFTWTSGGASITQANFLALGGYQIGFNEGSVTFSRDYMWDFDPRDGISSGAYDFEGAATHEIGHILGFMSDVDYVDYLLSLGQTGEPMPTPLDLFRFNTPDLGSNFDFTTTPRILAPGGSQSFYYGASAPMSTGAYYGDGRQASHWADSMGLGIMDPTAAEGEVLNISTNDLIAMDLIGWRVVPEPSTMVLLVMAGLIFSLIRHRLS